MPRDLSAALAQGGQALAGGDWPAARDAFRLVLAEADAAGTEPEPAALAGLGHALWWLGEVRDAVAQLERGYAGFRRRSEPVRAATIGLRLTVHYRASLGNAAAASGWLGRVRRLVEEHDLEPLRGWVLLLEAYGLPDPAQAEELARRAQALAGEVPDPDLELCALSQIGSALVGQGRVAEGVRYLDEAMAGSLAGEGGQLDTVVFTSCQTMISCTSCGEFERVVQWLRALDRFTERFGCPFLYVQCRVLYGTVLAAIGDWAQAEEELTAATRISRAAPGLHGRALAALAELRLAQGRVDEAEQLVAGFEDHAGAAAAVAAVLLVRGRPEAAESVLRQGLAELGEERLEAVAQLELLGEALIAQGRPGPAQDRGRALAELGRRWDCAVAVARGERLCGRALAAGPDRSTARDHLDAARAAFGRLGMPFEAARTSLVLARGLREESPAAAAGAARTALAGFASLSAQREAEAAAALLRELGEPVPRTGPGAPAGLTRREHEVLGLVGEGLSNPEIAERLYLSRKTVEHHVARVLAKLGLRGRAGAAAEAVRMGAVAGGPSAGANRR